MSSTNTQNVVTKHAQYVQSSECRKQRGLRFYQARCQTGKSIESFASLIGLAGTTLKKLESGEVDAKVKNVELAAYYSGLPVLWIMFGDIYQDRVQATTRDYYE